MLYDSSLLDSQNKFEHYPTIERGDEMSMECILILERRAELKKTWIIIRTFKIQKENEYQEKPSSSKFEL